MITSETFEKAIRFATKAHRTQKRKGNGSPYITHPISVMYRIKKYKKSANVYLLGAAAVLHDVVEDCGVELKTIAKKFGHSVASLVEELTLDKTQYDKLGKPQYLAQQLLNMSSYALAIKLCDRLDNICDMEHMSKVFIRRYVAETEYILENIKDRKLSKTHKKIIKLIKKELAKYK